MEPLAVLEREGLVDVFADTQLQVGEKWRQRLDAEMLRARVGLLLVSAPFLSSAFVRDEEVPRILDRHAGGGMLICPLLVRPCPWKHVQWLAQLQLRPQDAKQRPKAVSAFRGAARDQVLTDIADEIAALVAGEQGKVASGHLHAQAGAALRTQPATPHTPIALLLALSYELVDIYADYSTIPPRATHEQYSAAEDKLKKSLYASRLAIPKEDIRSFERVILKMRSNFDLGNRMARQLTGEPRPTEEQLRIYLQELNADLTEVEERARRGQY
jgi:hypothetical protein